MASEHKGPLTDWSTTLASSSSYIATEGDRWFVGALRGLQSGASRTSASVGRVGDRLADVSRKLRPGWWPSRPSSKERIHAVLRKEAKRSSASLSEREFDHLSAQIATLMDLVLAGTVSPEQIVFEAADETVLEQESSWEG